MREFIGFDRNWFWYERRKDWCCGYHVRTVLQDSPCSRSQEVLSRLDDVIGRGVAMDYWILHVCNSSNCVNNSCVRTLPDDGFLAE